MSETVEVVVIGAGIIGLCTAYQLARRAAGRILVLEKGSGLGEGSTGASSAVCRFRYSRDEMVQLARDGIRAYQSWSEFLELKDPLAAYYREGVLWLSDGDPDWPDREVERLARFGISSAALDETQVRECFPALNPCIRAPDFSSGEPHECRYDGRHFLEIDGGYVEPTDALQDVLGAARACGVEVRFRSQVTGFKTKGERIAGVTLGDGDDVSCNTVVNASGPWANSLLSELDLANHWPLVPTRIQIAQVDWPEAVQGPIPVCADPISGIYFRSQSGRRHIIVGSVLEEDERERVGDPDNFYRAADDEFVRTKLHALQHRIPALQQFRGVRGYSGLYTMNATDTHPIVGSTPVDGFYVANGCSGHGFKLAPAVGSLLAQQITGRRVDFDTHVDPAFLSFERSPIRLARKSVLA